VTELLIRKASLSERTVSTAREVLSGQRRGMGAYLAFAGPAIVASIAYIDPGNFATNIQAGAKYGYGLLWVVLLANMIAMLFQALSAKLGIVTGRNLAEMCRDRFPRPVVWAMWVISEIAAMATDLAEFLGGAIGLSLLFGLPLLAGMVLTGFIVYGILMFERFGFRPIELIIGNLVATIALCYLIEMFIAPVDWGSAALHTVMPELADAEALLLAVGIIGATVMPHAVYLHSGLTQARIPTRDEGETGTVVRISNTEVIIALAIAGLVNMAMVMMASSAFHAGRGDRNGLPHLDAAARHRGGRCVLGFAAGIGSIELDGGDSGRPDDHAGLRRLSHPDLGSTAGDDGAGFRRRRPWRQRDERARHQPGRAQPRPAASHGCLADLHPKRRHHGPVRQ
jgi:manganese transport protein